MVGEGVGGDGEGSVEAVEGEKKAGCGCRWES